VINTLPVFGFLHLCLVLSGALHPFNLCDIWVWIVFSCSIALCSPAQGPDFKLLDANTVTGALVAGLIKPVLHILRMFFSRYFCICTACVLAFPFLGFRGSAGDSGVPAL